MSTETQPVPLMLADIPQSTRDFLDVRETPTHFDVKTFNGNRRLHLKSDTFYSFELLRGILDDGKDTSEEKRNEKEWERQHDERKFGNHAHQDASRP